ncbi:MAG: HAD-IC family P-type ATPase, partial [Acidimicrobiia bacterium]
MTEATLASAPAHETPPTGLTAAEVAERVARGATNDTGERTSRTFAEIVRANVFTRFNAILGTMLVVILVVGPLNDALFGIVLVTNTLIGIVQEVRAKRTLDRLAVLSAPRARVVREGRAEEVAVEAVVLDDLLELRTGDQVPADGAVRTAEGLEVDESLLSGESEPVDKRPDDEVLSGSFVVAGTGRFQTTRVGDDAYARKLAAEARRFALVHSELMAGINLILRYVTWAIFPTALLLLFTQLRITDEGWREAMTGTVAGVVGMVPEGLVLLTSIAFAVAAVTLARRHVLVQELPAVEGLARVDVVCLDKTGTLTEGDVVFDRVEVLGEVPLDEVEEVLGALADDENANATLRAIGFAFPPPAGWRRTLAVPFSSARKWSGAGFDGHGAWVIGAPEMVWAHAPPDDAVRGPADELAASGARVLLLAHASELTGDELPHDMTAVALVLLEEKLRPDAPDTLRYFADQGVELKVISGDNPRTVG